MAQTLHTHLEGQVVDQGLVDMILTPGSHDRFGQDLEAFVAKHGLRGWIDSGESLVFLTDHGQFTDVPVLAETLGRIGLGRRATTVQVVSEMISDIELDIGDGPFPVMEALRRISSVVQSVPRLDGDPNEDVRAYRDRKNAIALRILEAVRNTEGSMTVMSLVARHNAASKKGHTLYIHEPNRRTLEGYVGSSAKIVPVYIDCPTFGEGGSVVPAEIRYEFFQPMFVNDSRIDGRRIVEMFREATSRTVGDRYRHGVKVRSWRAQMATNRVKAALPTTHSRESAKPRPDY